MKLFYQRKGGTKMFNYMILKSRSQGYCVLVKCNGFWQQISKWYRYYGNLKRYCKEANEPAYYKISD